MKFYAIFNISVVVWSQLCPLPVLSPATEYMYIDISNNLPAHMTMFADMQFEVNNLFTVALH